MQPLERRGHPQQRHIGPGRLLHHHQAGGDELTSGTGEAWDLPAPPEHERDRDAAADTAPHTSSDHSAPPLAVIADIRAKLAEIRRQTAR